MASNFYETILALDNFAEAVRAENCRPLPDDWVVGFADVAGSTKAVADGRYKAVNMVGAGVIAAVVNALEHRPFPFAFGGDGASFAVSPTDALAATGALAAMAAFAREEFEFDLRVATIPIGEIRAAGRDVRVARYAATQYCVYAMFMGGGLAWFEDEVKRGRHLLPAAASGARPDLSGLSCRWGVAPARSGLILSLIVAPRGDDPRFAALVQDIVGLALASDRPVTLTSLRPGDPAKAIKLEMAIKKSAAPRPLALLSAAYNYLGTTVFFALGPKGSGVSAKIYKADLVANADFRKFDDGLRMTLDCSAGFAGQLEARLAAAEGYALAARTGDRGRRPH